MVLVHVEEDACIELVCPRCGSVFGRETSKQDASGCGDTWDVFVSHAQREHDLDEVEVYALLFKGAPAGPARD